MIIETSKKITKIQALDSNKQPLCSNYYNAQDEALLFGQLNMGKGN